MPKGIASRMCYGLNVCVFLKFLCCDSNPQGMVLGDGALGRLLDHKGGALINGISALILL